MALLTDWANFYVIVGSSAGALTGLTVVAVTMVAGRERRAEEVNWGTSTFTTPTVVQFGVVLLVSAVLSAPWPAIWPTAILLALCGVAGLVYSVIVVRRFRRSTGYEPDREDWLWYAVAPLTAYAALVITGLWLLGNAASALFGVGAVTLGLVFIGIHNAWALVAYFAAELSQSASQREEQGERKE